MNDWQQTDPAAAKLTASQLLQLADQPATSPLPGGHCVQFFDDDSFLIEAITDYVRAGLVSGEACIVIATQPHPEALAARLLSHGLDVVNDGLGAQYYSFDAGELRAQFLVNDEIDQERFIATVREVVRNVQGRTVTVKERVRHSLFHCQTRQLRPSISSRREFARRCHLRRSRAICVCPRHQLPDAGYFWLMMTPTHCECWEKYSTVRKHASNWQIL